ncbi:MAG: hydroxymethylglutaryl-CoA synthase [Bacteroidota bacterium]
MKNTHSVGIDDMALYVPKLYLPIETLAAERQIEYVKLNKGLGLTHMAIPDVHEDAATMAANAVSELIDKNELNPQDIGRIYLGTESALDGAKPTATYVVQMLKQKYAPICGGDCFKNCDVVDLTFACVGGVDALHNTLDWVRGDESRIGIVVTSDFAKYELASTGEYTQGAGAVALLVKHQPRLLAISDPVGVGMQSAHDFYKPLRTFSKKQIVEETLRLAGVEANAMDVLEKLNGSLEVNGFIDDNDEILTIHKDTPIFDGPYSNLTYQNRIREAYEHWREQAIGKEKIAAEESILNRWERLIFHLPYAFHGKRIFSEIYMQEKMLLGEWNDFAADNELEIPQRDQFDDQKTYDKAYANFLRAITKTTDYRAMVKEKLEKAQRASGLVGNMYACSIFLALMSTLNADLEENANLEGKQLGFFGYGSGSKSKVFEAEVQPEWKTVVENFKLNDKLENRNEIDYKTYEQLHRKRLGQSVQTDNGKFALAEIGTEGVKLGARYYELK